MKLSNKIALVTGGTSGIGLAAAELFRQEGAKVVVVGIDEDRLKAAAAALGDDGITVAADLRRPAEIDRAPALRSDRRSLRQCRPRPRCAAGSRDGGADR